MRCRSWRPASITFVDKPFCEDLGQAREMVAAARRTGAVLFSSSPWKWSPAVQEVKRRLPELGDVRSAICSGPGPQGAFFYVTHSVETLQFLFGTGVDHVTCISDALHHAIMLQYADGRVGFVNAMRNIAWLRHAVVYGVNGYLEADISNPQRDEGMVRLMVEFVRAIRSGAPPLPLEYPLEATAIMVAAQRSASEGGRRLYLGEFE